MTRIAKKTTYGHEDVGGGVEVRRRVVAGQRIPDHYDVPSGDVEDLDPSAVVSPAYPEGQVTRRVGSDGRLKSSRKTDGAPVSVAEKATRQPGGSGKH